MSSIKWIKINTDMFDDEKIKIIQSMPEGDALLVVWIRLITLAGKTNNGGYIYISDNLPYTDEMLSTIMNKPLNIIKLAIQTFINFGMIEIDEKGIYLVNFKKHQSLDRMQEIREYNRLAQQKHRAKLRLEMESKTCQYCGGEATGYDHILCKYKGGADEDYNKVPCCPTCNKKKSTMDVVEFLNNNLDRINIDIVKNNKKLSQFVKFNGKYFDNVNDSQLQSKLCHDIDKDIDKDIDNSSSISLIETIEKEFGSLSSMQYEEIDNLSKTYDNDLILEALKECAINNVRTIKYLKGILNNWQKENIKSVSDLKNKQETSEEQPVEIFEYDWMNDENV